jgi:hypothetical protein
VQQVSSRKKEEYISTTRERRKKDIYAARSTQIALLHPILHVYSLFYDREKRKKDLVFRCLLWLFTSPFCLVDLWWGIS